MFTILVTGAPSSSTGQQKFNSLGKQIGAPAGVSGVWVFNADDFGNSAGSSDTIKMVLLQGIPTTHCWENEFHGVCR